MAVSVQMWSSAPSYCVIMWVCTGIFEECAASVRVKIEGAYFSKIVISVYKVVW